MKQFSLLPITALVITLGLSASGQAIVLTPTLSHEYHTGFVPEERAYSMKCEIFPAFVKAEIKQPHGKKTIYEQPLNLPENTPLLIEGAKKGLLTTGPAPADIGVSIYQAYIIEPNDTVNTVDLGTLIDSQFRTINHAPEAQQLRQIIDTICNQFVPTLPDHH